MGCGPQDFTKVLTIRPKFAPFDGSVHPLPSGIRVFLEFNDLIPLGMQGGRDRFLFKK
jgi:hypothetical protein